MMFMYSIVFCENFIYLSNNFCNHCAGNYRGSSDLKANHAIRQYVDIVSEKQKYDK